MQRLAVAALLVTTACGASSDPDPHYPLDGVLRLHQVQAKGTHNSYHVQEETPIAGEHRYTHAPLDVQLENQGVRQFEIDLHLRKDQGFEVFHIPFGDDETTCRRFVDCLALVKAWSDANPLHLPIVLWLEPKDEADPLLDPTLEYIEGRYDEIEAEILSVFPAERILMPDEVRGEYATLPAAVRADGFPTLGELRGRVIFSMLDSGTHRDAYTADSPNLAGKLMFVDASSADQDFAAMFKINNAASDAGQVQALLEQGFVITSNVDGAGQSDADNTTKLAASLASGTNFLSSDFPDKAADRDYWFDMPGGAPARCNPLTAPPECTAEDIERLP